MKKYPFIICSLALALSACFDDKGNYDYEEITELNIENIPELIEVLGNSDQIVVTPKITSPVEGEILDGNPNYEFTYKLEKKTGGTLQQGQQWVKINQNNSLNVDTIAAFPAGTYIVWFSAKDLRTGIEATKTFDIKVTSPTYEGWMVLCNEGKEERVRLDMISAISATRIVPAYDLMPSLGLPEVKHATGVGFYPNVYASGDVIYLMSEEGTFKINQNTFQTNKSWNINLVDFIIPPTEGSVVEYKTLNGGSMYGGLANFCITNAGDAFVQVLGNSGAAFEKPINTSIRGGKPEYKVAPYVGISMARPGNGASALFYDTDNKRFVGWRDKGNSNAKQTLTPLTDPENPKFSFNTGMELVYMESTRYSGGLVYSILQDKAGKRVIYGINMAGNGFSQESLYENLNAPDFDKATAFAFHSKFPYMFYAVKNKVYLHNLGTNTTYPMDEIKLGSTEEVTMLKFNLYQQTSLDFLNNQTDEFMERQYELMVGSYDNASKDDNGGKLGFYPVNGINNSISKRTEFNGFAKIKDVVYRERR